MDWVVNDATYGVTGANLPNASQAAYPLTFPKFISGTVDPTLAIVFPGMNFPEQSRGQTAFAVRGHYRLSPGTWAAGSAFRVMVRIVCKPMQYSSAGVMIEDPNYTLFGAEFANERFLWQRYHFEQFGGGDYGEVFSINASFRQHIREDEALFIVFENQTGVTQTVVLETFLRTLMRADE